MQSEAMNKLWTALAYMNVPIFNPFRVNATVNMVCETSSNLTISALTDFRQALQEFPFVVGDSQTPSYRGYPRSPVVRVNWRVPDG